MDYRNLDWTSFLDELSEKSFVVLDHFLSPKEIEALLRDFQGHREAEELKRAGIGNTYLYQKDKEVRGDSIIWIDSEHSSPSSLSFYQKMMEFMQDLNRGLLLSMKEIEAHFALYPPGSFYKKHLDQFKNNGHRILSFACYLNPDWRPGDGGELEVFQEKESLLIEPLAGRLVLFRSDIVEHAVLRAYKDRISVTGWMLDRPIDLPIHY